MIYGVEKSKMKKYPDCRAVYIESISSTRSTHLGKKKGHRLKKKNSSTNIRESNSLSK